MKICRKCQKNLKLSEYYKHPEMLDGYLNICITCTKIRVGVHRLKNLDKIRCYDRERGNRQHKSYSTEYYAANKEKVKKTKKEWVKKNINKRKAHMIVGYSIKIGKVKKPKKCEICKKISTRIYGHHDDYSKPLFIKWLCSICHGQRHKELNKIKRSRT